ncbi:MAG: hypothetical protein AAGD43_21425 [Pseudomonadota bacterium]
MTEQLKASLWSDPIGKLIISLLAGAVLWMANTVQQLDANAADKETLQALTTKVAVQSEKIEAMRSVIAAATVDTYTGSQAKSDRALLTQRLQTLSDRLRRVEDTMHDHKKGSPL